MKKILCLTFLLASTIWSANAAEFGFEGGVSNVSAAIKADTRTVFKAAGFTEHKGNLTGAAFYAFTGPIVAEVNGGNVGAGGNGYIYFGASIEYDLGGMAVFWINGNDLTFNRTALNTLLRADQEELVFDALFIFFNLF